MYGAWKAACFKVIIIDNGESSNAFFIEFIYSYGVGVGRRDGRLDVLHALPD